MSPLLLCLFLLVLGFPGGASAAPPAAPGTEQTDAAPEKPAVPPDPLGRRTPQGAVTGYISAVAQEDYEKAASYLDLGFMSSRQRSTRGPQLAQRLQRLLDQRGTVQATPLISDKPEGTLGDELEADQERVGVIRLDDKRIPVMLTRGEDENGHPIWRVASATIEALPAEEATPKDVTPLDRVLPEQMVEHKWGGIPIGHWLAMLLLAVASYLVAWLFTASVTFLIRMAWDRARNRREAKLIKAFALPIRLYLAVLLLVYTGNRAGISIVVRQYFGDAMVVVAWLAILILCWRLIDASALLGEQRMYRKSNAGGLSAILFFRRTGKFVLVIVGILTILDTVGLEVATWLAALGIGGIALALGAQKTVENLVGSLTVIFDQPVRVGDYCKVGTTTGTVENIGMRSTRIRTLSRTLVTIPNGYFSDQQIENYAHRDRFLMQAILGLRYETTAEQLRWLLVELRSLLYAHPKVNPDPARIRFTGFADFSLKLELFAYIDVPEYDEFLEVQEDLYLRIMDVVEKSGSGFAFPSSTLYVGRDQGVSTERAEEVRATVQEWRESGELELPRFDPEKIQSLRGTIPWPPEGSSSRPKTGMTQPTHGPRKSP